MEDWDESWDDVEAINQDVYVENRLEHLKKSFDIDVNLSEDEFTELQENNLEIDF